MNNKELIEKYPFLKVNDSDCWLDELEPGWRIAFGKELCEELAAAIKEDGCEDTFEIDQIKEKYAELCIYAHGYGKKTNKILNKYQALSRYVCGHCGKLATKITRGYFYPLCSMCVKDIHGAISPIENFYGFDSYHDVQEEVINICHNMGYEEYWKRP